jgi:AraC-like DNA-binding protein
MEYMTVKEAAEQWGVSVRRVQYLCVHEMIPGAVRFGNLWSIPKDADRPRDGRYKAKEERPNDIETAFQKLEGNEEMLSRIIEFFPYPIHVYSSDGTMVLTNEACLRVMHIPSKEHLIGKFNVLKDPVIDRWGNDVREQIARSFKGETVLFHDLQMPIQGIIDRFENDELCFDSSFQNITCFPVYDENSKLAYVVHVFVTSKLYDGRQEMVKAKEYIDSHWMEDFDLDKTALSVNLGKHHFSRLFKRHTSMTPFSYYQDIKISKLKEKLCDNNLSIGEAFSACGVDYNGNYARLFREKVGLTPSQYRKSVKQK